MELATYAIIHSMCKTTLTRKVGIAMSNEDIKVPYYVVRNVDEKIVKQQKIIREAEEQVSYLTNLRSIAIEQYITEEKQRQETERLVELGRQYDSILKGETNET